MAATETPTRPGAATDARGLVLIVDDERDLRALLEFNLRQAGYRTAQAGTGAEALSRARTLHPSAIVLDLNLPDVAGTDVCRLLKSDAATADIRILMLTARGSEEDRIRGLELGADDYVVKPFSVREVVLRIDAVLRRAPQEPGGARPPLTDGGVVIDRDTWTVAVDGAPVALTLIEFRLLTYLVERGDRVCTREALLVDVWDASPEIETRTVDTHVKRLRDKLGAAGERVETVRGVGYRWRRGG